MSNLKKVLNHLNVPKKLCHVLLGKSSKPTHRMLVGLIFMIIGVSLSKHLAHTESYFADYFGDLIGYAIHGTGLIPFIEYLTTVTE